MRRLYVWWLYHGPGFKSIRRALRINDEILPIKGVVYDAHFTGKNAIEAEHAVAVLRSEVIDHTQVREVPAKISEVLEGRRLVVDAPVKVADMSDFPVRRVRPQREIHEELTRRISALENQEQDEQKKP